MKLTKQMVDELINVFLLDMPSSLVLKRDGALDRANINAGKVSEQLKSELYDGHTLRELVRIVCDLYTELLEAGMVSDVILGEHAWFVKYIPIFNSFLIDDLIEVHQRTYGYTDKDEIYLSSLITLVLAYNSDPELFTSNRNEFLILSKTWLKAMMSFNCKKAPQLAAEFPTTWHDNSHYSVTRNLILCHKISETYLAISHGFAKNLGTKKWIDRVTAFEEIQKIMMPVLIDDDNVRTELPSVIRHLNYVKNHPEEFKVTQVAFPDDAKAIPVVAIATEQDIPAVAVAIDANQQDMMDAGIRLMISGIGKLMAGTPVGQSTGSDEEYKSSYPKNPK